MALDIGEVCPCKSVIFTLMVCLPPRCQLRGALFSSGVVPVMVLILAGSVFKTGASGGGIHFIILILQWTNTGVKIFAGSGQITRIQGRVSLTPGRSLPGSLILIVFDLLLIGISPTRTKEHCLMGIKGTVRRSTDGDFIHANVDIDLIIDEEPVVCFIQFNP